MKKIINKIINGEVLNLKNHILAENPYTLTSYYDLCIRDANKYYNTLDGGEIKIFKVDGMLVFDSNLHLPTGDRYQGYSQRLVFIKK